MNRLIPLVFALWAMGALAILSGIVAALVLP